MERYKRLKRENRIRRFKLITILLIISTMSYGLILVNSTIQDFDLIKNDNLIRIDIDKRSIDLFGQSYYIDLDRILHYIDIEKIKNVFN